MVDSTERTLADPVTVSLLRHQVGEALVEQRRRYTLAGTPLESEDERQLTRQLIDEAVREHAARQLTESLVVPQSVQEELGRAVWAAMYQADRLQMLLDDPDVENVNIIGHDKVFVRYAGGRKERLQGGVAGSDEELVQLVRRMAGWVGLSSRPWDVTNPFLRLRLPDGERLTAINWVCARPSVSIRRNLHPDMSLAKMVSKGTCTPVLAAFLKAAVLARLTLAVAGDGGAGKTTTARALIREIPSHERIFSAEASLELDIEAIGVHDDVVELEARDAYGEQVGGVSLTDLVRAMLTQNVDRQIVGECTGPEVIALLNAALAGSGGSITTIHTKRPKGVPNRIATFASQAEERLSREASLMLVAEALELVVYMRVVRDRATGAERRVISDVVEINGFNGNEVAQSTLFAYDPATGQAEPDPEVLMQSWSMARLKDAGFDPYAFGLTGAGGWGSS
jgi:pilus assembly protein CpaF